MMFKIWSHDLLRQSDEFFVAHPEIYLVDLFPS